MSANAASSTPTEVLGKKSLSLIDAQRGSDWCAPEASEHVGQFLLYGRSGTMADLSAALRVDLDARHEAWLLGRCLHDVDNAESARLLVATNRDRNW